MKKINFNINPVNYKHWEVKIENNIGYLIFNVNEDEGLFGDYKLKLNSYDLGVDIELLMLFRDLDLSILILI